MLTHAGEVFKAAATRSLLLKMRSQYCIFTYILKILGIQVTESPTIGPDQNSSV